ncbi:HEXXH motif-containing putative peptide modification protein [Nonomuraea sp. NPDC046570]|uniref:aKG-HExxH-type peptide beta-hydroxylase n=1 Tax=Nonomuraea sp. NPDC046570 TaxID=3155255 RepID=UPI0033F7C159
MISALSVRPDLFAELSRGGGGPAAMRLLGAARHSRHLLLLRAIVGEVGARAHPQAAATAAGYRELARVERASPAAVAAVLRYPLVGAWGAHTLLGLLRDDPAARPERLAALAAAAAVRGRVPTRTTFPAEEGGAALPSLGRAHLPGLPAGSPVVLDLTAGAARLDLGGVRMLIPRDPYRQEGRWQGLRRLAPGLLLDDVDPWRFPGTPSPLDRLPEREVAVWRERLRGGLGLLAGHHRPTAAAMAATTVVVPLTAPEGGARSATSRAAYGCVALSLPEDARSAALALTHELQHAKLAALMDLFDLVRDDHGQRFYAPWREDPRPAGALLQGAYAHLGVAGFWRAQRHVEADAGAHVEFVRWRDASLESALALRSSGAVTALGRRFVAGMLHTLTGWLADPAPEDAAATARRAATRHRARWSHQ